MFVVRETIFEGQLLCFLLTTTNFHSPIIGVNLFGKNFVSTEEYYQQNRTRKHRHQTSAIITLTITLGVYNCALSDLAAVLNFNANEVLVTRTNYFLVQYTSDVQAAVFKSLTEECAYKRQICFPAYPLKIAKSYYNSSKARKKN